jgi:hypothetical protein
MWSMRCEIGCPIETFVQQFIARPLTLAQSHVDLGGLDALHVLVELGAAGAPGGGHHLGLRQQDLLDARADLV